MPSAAVNYPKDMAWNTRKINSAVLQGILQGESITKISKRLLPILDNNESAAVRNARTMVTSAENHGRLDRYHDYEDEGIVMTKMWLATPDGRTRDWHLDMDGQEVPVEDPFIDGLGNELEYPGDEMAPGETVYNCRCSMRSHITGVRGADGRIIPVKDFDSMATGFHQAQISAERFSRW